MHGVGLVTVDEEQQVEVNADDSDDEEEAEDVWPRWSDGYQRTPSAIVAAEEKAVNFANFETLGLVSNAALEIFHSPFLFQAHLVVCDPILVGIW